MNLKNNNFKKAVFKLTAYYSVGVFTILLIFSFVFFFIFSYEIKENINELEDDHEELFLDDLDENILNIIVWIDFSVLILIIAGSYLLSKKTLQPLEESYLRQKRFIANASHEFKTPLAIIRAGSETLLRKDREIEEYKSFMNDLLEETDRLSELSNELLYISDIKESDKKELINCSDITEKYILNTKPYADNKNIKLYYDIEKGIELKIKKNDFIRILINLLKNSIDYNNENGKVEVFLKREGVLVKLIVKDSGIGIAKDKLNLILEPFYKIDDSRSKHKGSGLGLSIVKEIVDKNNAEIVFDSELEKGTTVTVTFKNN